MDVESPLTGIEPLPSNSGVTFISGQNSAGSDQLPTKLPRPPRRWRTESSCAQLYFRPPYSNSSKYMATIVIHSVPCSKAVVNVGLCTINPDRIKFRGVYNKPSFSD